MGLINWPILFMAACCTFMAVVRVRQVSLRGMPLWEINRTIGGFGLLAATAVVYAFQGALEVYAPRVASIAFPLGMILLGGSLDLMVYTLRHPRISHRTSVRILLRSAVIASVLVVIWAFGIPTQRGNPLELRDHLGLRVFAVVFHGYLAWVLGSVVASFGNRARDAWSRRRLKASSYLLVAIGCAYFLIINLLYLSAWSFGWSFNPGAPGHAIFFGCIVGGAILLVVGEPLAAEIRSRRRLRSMAGLWRRLSHLSGDPGVLAAERAWSSQVQLQRAYAEIADALSALSPTQAIAPTSRGVARAIHSGDVERTRPGSLSLSELLPSCSSRTEDQLRMKELARHFDEIGGGGQQPERRRAFA